MEEKEAKELADFIVKVARAICDEGKTVKDLAYCKSLPDAVCFCDDCDSLLNIQEDFDKAEGYYKCRKCGYLNKMTEEENITSFEEYEHKEKNRMA